VSPAASYSGLSGLEQKI